MSISNEIQALELQSDEGLVVLYQLEWVPAEGNTAAVYLNFHSYDSTEDLTFDNEIYHGMPIEMDGVERNADGPSNRPGLQIPNIETIFRSSHPLREQLQAEGIADFQLEDLLNKRVIQRKTLRKYVKVGTETTTSAHTNAYQFPKNEYVIDRIASKTAISVTLELSSPFDLANVKVPNRIVTGKYCPWSYKGWKLDKTDVKSACHWTTKKRDANGDTPFVFFTVDDEPLIFDGCLNGTLTELVWSSQTTYVTSNIVAYNGLLYQSLADSNLNNTPEEVSGFWRIVRTYSEWTNTLTGATPPGDTRKNTYAFKNGKVYKCVKAHNASGVAADARDPETNPSFWAEADVCGKLLSSCKARYQMDSRAFVPAQNNGTKDLIVPVATDSASNKHMVPTAIFDNQVSLPFGGFPGTRTFR